MALTFFMTPGSCSTGIHILLETLELPFSVTILNLPAGDHRQPAYLALNPKGSMPALQLNDGQVLTEFQAIAFWLARSYPKAGLLPDEPLLAAQVMALMDYVVGTVHGQGFTRIFTTDTYLPQGLDAAERERWSAAIQAQGRDMVGRAFEVIAASLPDDGFVAGPRLSVADAALFYVEFWADKIGLPMPAPCQAHYERMKARPVVRQVLAEEGYR